MFHLKLFGHFELTGPAGRIALSSTKLSAFLAYLALAAKPVPREHLTTLLWGSHFDEQARQNFRQALARLRKLVGPVALVSDDQAVQLSSTVVASDARQFESLVRSASEVETNAMPEPATARSAAWAKMLEVGSFGSFQINDWMNSPRHGWR